MSAVKNKRLRELLKMGYGLMDGQIDGPTDEPTDPSIEMCVRI